MWSDEESVVVRPGFNQPVKLGLLYDVSRDKLVCCEGTHVALWNAEDIDRHTEVLKKPRVRYGCMINNSLETERELLSVTGGVGVGDPVGLIKASVSGTYTKEKWCADDIAEFKVYRSSELDFQHLDLTGLNISYNLPAVKSVSDEASHVVLGIQYASSIVVTFQRKVRQRQERTKCELELKLTVLWIFSVSTKVTMYANQINEYSEHISCSVKLDDASLKSCSIQEAIEVLQQGTRRTVPKYVMLYPLRKLFGKIFKTKPVVPLSDTLSNRIIEFFDNMFKLSTSAQNAVWRANIQHLSSTNQLVRPLLHFREAVWGRVTVVRDELEEIIPQIRSTNRSETDAFRMLECEGHFNNWLTSKFVEIKLVQKGLTELESRCKIHNTSVRKFLKDDQLRQVTSCERPSSDGNERQGYDNERQQEESNQSQQKDQCQQVDDQRLLSNGKNCQQENENKVQPGGDLGQYDHSAVCRLYHRDQEDPNLAMLRDGDMKAMMSQTKLKTSFIALRSIRDCIQELTTYLTQIGDSTCHCAVESLHSTDIPSMTLTCQEAPVRIVHSLVNSITKEAEQTTLECEVSKVKQQATWLHDGQEIQSTVRVSASADGAKHTLTISETRLEDRGIYSLECGSAKTYCTLDVEEVPVRIIRPLISEIINECEPTYCTLNVEAESELKHLAELVADCEHLARTLLDNIADWIRARERTIGNMNDITNKLDKLQKDCDIAKTKAVAYGVTAGAAAIAHTRISSSEIEQARTLLTRDRDLSELIAKGYSLLRGRSQEIVRLLESSRHLCYYLGPEEDHEWQSAEQLSHALLLMVGAEFPGVYIRHMTWLTRGPLSARVSTGGFELRGISEMLKSGVAGAILGAALGPLGAALQLVGCVGNLVSESLHEHSKKLRQTSSEMNASLEPMKDFWEFLKILKNGKEALVHIVTSNRLTPIGFLTGSRMLGNERRVTQFIWQILPHTLPQVSEVDYIQTRMEVVCEIFKRITEEIGQKDASISGRLRKITHIDIVLLGHGHIEYGGCRLETACVTNMYTYQPWGCALDGSAAVAIIRDLLTPESRTYCQNETYDVPLGVSDRVPPSWNDLVATAPPVRIFLGKQQAPGDEARSALVLARQALSRDKTFGRIVIPCYDTPPLPLEIYTAALSLSCFLHGITCTGHVAASLEDPLALKSTGLDRTTSEHQHLEQIKRDCEENYCYFEPYEDNGRRVPVTMTSPFLVGDQKLRHQIDAILQD